MVIGSLCHLVKDITPEQERKALILGWCIEWVSYSILAILMCVYSWNNGMLDLRPPSCL